MDSFWNCSVSLLTFFPLIPQLASQLTSACSLWNGADYHSFLHNHSIPLLRKPLDPLHSHSTSYWIDGGCLCCCQLSDLIWSYYYCYLSESSFKCLLRCSLHLVLPHIPRLHHRFTAYFHEKLIKYGNWRIYRNLLLMILSILGFRVFKILVHLVFIRFNLVRILISSTLRLT